jgi:hypothetical protein
VQLAQDGAKRSPGLAWKKVTESRRDGTLLRPTASCQGTAFSRAAKPPKMMGIGLCWQRPIPELSPRIISARLKACPDTSVSTSSVERKAIPTPSPQTPFPPANKPSIPVLSQPAPDPDSDSRRTATSPSPALPDHALNCQYLLGAHMNVPELPEVLIERRHRDVPRDRCGSDQAVHKMDPGFPIAVQGVEIDSGVTDFDAGA